MATDKTGTWSLGESVLWYTPNTALDNTWSYGENAFLDEYASGSAATAKIGGAPTSDVSKVGGAPIGNISKIGGTPK